MVLKGADLGGREFTLLESAEERRVGGVSAQVIVHVALEVGGVVAWLETALEGLLTEMATLLLKENTTVIMKRGGC